MMNLSHILGNGGAALAKVNGAECGEVDRRGAGLCGSLLLGRQLRAQDQVVEDELTILGNVNGLFASVVIGTNVATNALSERLRANWNETSPARGEFRKSNRGPPQPPPVL